MKYLLLIPFFILLGCAQPKIEKIRIPTSEVHEFLEQEKYSALSNLISKNIIASSYNSLLEFLHENEMNKSNYYFKTDEIKITSNYLTIPMYHFDGILVEMDQAKRYEKWKNEKKDDDLNYFPFIKGNLSGKDGNLEIDLKTNEVVVFSKWK